MGRVMESIVCDSPRMIFYNSAPVVVIAVVTGAIALPYTTHNDIMPQNIFLGANYAVPLRADLVPTIYVTDLDNPAYSLAQPIAISLQENDGEYIISFPDAEITTSGDTPGEALKWLKDSVVSTFEVLGSERSALGPLPKRQLQALEKYIVKKQIRAA